MRPKVEMLEPADVGRIVEQALQVLERPGGAQERCGERAERTVGVRRVVASAMIPIGHSPLPGTRG